MMSNPSNCSALRRVQRDDRILTHLLMCEPPTTVRREGPHFDMTHIKDDGPGLGRICDAIGGNTHLRDVCFDAPVGLCDLAARTSLFDGLRENASIRSLGLSRCDLSRGVGREVLRAFEENHERLTKIALWRCSVRYNGPEALAATLARCSRLTEISLSSCSIGDDIVEKLVEAVRGNDRLETLDLQENHIRRAGCQALATLLEDPGCNLVDLDLHNNMIDNRGAKAVADALAYNRKLEILYLDDNYITTEGWNAYNHILCNESSINTTYSSNHTLRTITSFRQDKAQGVRMHDDDGVIPNRLFELLEFNQRIRREDPDRHRARAARRKILEVHFRREFDMGPFAGGNMDTTLLPHVLSWAARPCRIRRYGETTGQTALYELLRQTPTLCDMSRGIKGFIEKAEASSIGNEIETGNRDNGSSAKQRSRFGSVLRSTKKAKLFKKWKMSKLLMIRLVVLVGMLAGLVL